MSPAQHFGSEGQIQVTQIEYAGTVCMGEINIRSLWNTFPTFQVLLLLA